MYKSAGEHLQNCIRWPAVQHHLPPFFSTSPPVREASTHEQPFLISHTFEKCQKCFMRLVSVRPAQSDIHTGPIKAHEGPEGRRCVPQGHCAVQGTQPGPASAASRVAGGTDVSL